MHKKMMILAAVSVVLLVMAAGCDKNQPTENRSVVTVISFNESQTLISDVLEQGNDLADPGDDYILPDIVQVEFYNRPYSGMIITDPDKPHGEFIITRYRVEWERTDGGTYTLPTYEAGLGISVPTGEDVDGAITLVTFDNKANTPLWDIRVGGPNQGEEIQMTAHVTFYGYEAGTDRETAIETSLGVLFVDLFVESD
jgi:hypothetical protein